ncbi:MAG: hypothetical protein U1E60_12240 [Reyranellaceae bacterium]
MLRGLMRVLISRHAIGILALIIVVPLVLAIRENWEQLFVRYDLHEPMDIVTGIGIILIALGVVLEERKALREIFDLVDGPDEAWQQSIDHLCHHYGVGQLVLGLMAEICIEMIKIPNTIIYTGDVDDYLVAVGCVFLAIAAVLLVRMAVVLIFLMGQHRSH